LAKSASRFASRQTISQAELARLIASTRSSESEVGDVPFALGRGRGKILGGARIHQQFVRNAGKGRELFPARMGAAFGHHRAGVPMQDAGGFVDRADAREACLQALIGGVAHAGLRRRRAKAASTPTSDKASPYQVIA
jgi:hypothetical protein